MTLFGLSSRLPFYGVEFVPTMSDYLHSLPAGHLLGEYRIDHVLGSGGFGITYYARDIHLGKPFAIKEYLPNEFALRAGATTVKPKSAADQDAYQWGLGRFLDEGQTLAHFDHPHLNKVYRFLERNGTAYMVLEYIEGETLSTLLKREGQLNPVHLRRLLDELLSGLGEVHAAGFVHRDVKPGNIMFRKDGASVLLDFGTARQVIGQRSKSITSILTPGYAPIEQYDQKAESVGPWTDLYALGIVAYRCISGLDESDLPDAVTRARLKYKGEEHKDMVPAMKIGKGRHSEALLRAVDWAVKVHEEQRPQSVAVMKRALAGSDDLNAMAPSTSITDQSPQSSKLPKKQKGKRRRNILVSTSAAVAMVATGAIGWPIIREHLDWQEMECNDVASVQQHLSTYPGGRYEKEATFCLAQIAWEREEFRDCEQCPEMVVLPAGVFMMGSPSSEEDRHDDEGPRHRVTITKSFAVGKYEVTFAQWDACRRAGDCLHNPDDELWGRGNRPVIHVSWDDVQEYVQGLSRRTGKRYRLLSESEWEYAARAGTADPFHFGGTISTDQANFNGDIAYGSGHWGGRNRRKTVAVGSFSGNSFGLHDIHGNVKEWVQDCWHENYAGAPSDGSTWTVGGNCDARVLRGGSWRDYARDIRSGSRIWSSPEGRGSIVGFRVARTLEAKYKAKKEGAIHEKREAHTKHETEAKQPEEKFLDCEQCPEMVVLPTGSFMMGSPSSGASQDDGEGPRHRVAIAKSFAVGKYEVTFAQWDACWLAGGCSHIPGDEGWGRGNRPVIHVSWNDTQEYVQWLFRKTGKRYRLLSESEWEYAARAGTAGPFYFGDTIPTNQANYNEQDSGFPGLDREGVFRKKTVAVGSFLGNNFGLHNMHGNVAEWVQDCWHESYAGAPSDGSAWTTGENCDVRILRGGSWYSSSDSSRSGSRARNSSGARYKGYGFRVARALTP